MDCYDGLLLLYKHRSIKRLLDTSNHAFLGLAGVTFVTLVKLN